MSETNWLDKFRNNPEAQEALRAKAKVVAGTKRDQLPNLACPVGVPMFVRTLEQSRVIPKTAYGPREVVDVVILETTDPAQEAGVDVTMWVTQSMFKSQIEKFRDEAAGVIDVAGETRVRLPKDLDLFILNNGKERSESSGYSFWNYTILTAQEGKDIILGL